MCLSDVTPKMAPKTNSAQNRGILERRSRVLCRRVMHGSEIQAKYGNNAWRNMYVWVPGKYYAPRKIPRTPEIWKFYEAQLRPFFRMGVNRPLFRVHTHAEYTLMSRTCRSDQHRRRPPPAPPMPTPPTTARVAIRMAPSNIAAADSTAACARTSRSASRRR